MTKEDIARINALARKAKETGLTDAEKAEQTALRTAYVSSAVPTPRDITRQETMRSFRRYVLLCFSISRIPTLPLSPYLSLSEATLKIWFSDEISERSSSKSYV